jgi:zinc transporter ZupT
MDARANKVREARASHAPLRRAGGSKRAPEPPARDKLYRPLATGFPVRAVLEALTRPNAKVSDTKALMLIGVMTIHSATEGIAQGVAFGGGEWLGIWVAVALSVHNIAEGLAVSLVLIPRAVRMWVASFWVIFTSIPQPVLAPPPAFLAVEVARPLLPIGLGFAEGAMLRMVFCELLPDALEEGSSNTVAIVAVISAITMTTFQAVM